MLKGEKVILKPMRRDFLERYSEFLNDVELLLLSSDVAPMPMEYERVVAQFEEHLKRPRGDLLWFGIEVQGGKFVGQCILHHFDYAARTCELGITIGDGDYQNRKYGRDAVALLARYAFRLLNMEKVWLTTIASNERAAKAFRAAGFEEEGRLRRHVWLDGRYDDLVYMSCFREGSRPAEPESQEQVESDPEISTNATDEA
ncbi:GNAT family protein [Candidatus Amarobacter glycogenicus]|uniref:GNAT family N-acetyltransferase n=1 Tax=Candidatus Amarobacter glycogenicus TaxID=3140699 RepID=UPI0031375A9C|nr:GNAT family N-acetyltransferase [Dehalococcoidia bacterium]